MFPYPSGAGPARRPPAGLHRHRRLRPLPADDRPQRGPHHGLRRVRPARRAVRAADQHPPAGHHRDQHRQHASASCGAWAWATTAAARSPPPTRTSTAGPSGSSCRSSAPGTTPRPTGPGPSPSWRPSSTPAPASRRPAPTPPARPWADLDASERRAVHQRPPPGLPGRGAGQLVPGPGHGAGQRGGHRRRPLRAGQLPGLPAAHEAVDAAHHRLRRPPDRRPGPARLDRGHQEPAAQLDRPLHRRRGRASPRRPGRSRCSPPGPTRCSAPPTWCVAPEHPLVDAADADLARRHAAWTAVRHRRRRRPYVAAAAAPTWTARPRARTRPACSPAPTPPTR